MAPPLSEANLCVKIDFGQRYGSEEAVWFTINMIELWAIPCVSRGKFMRQSWRINESNNSIFCDCEKRLKGFQQIKIICSEEADSYLVQSTASVNLFQDVYEFCYGLSGSNGEIMYVKPSSSLDT